MSKPRQSQTTFIPRRIVSGGQTGVDRAALDVAIALDVEHGGWCPAGRLSEDGSIPSRYQMTESDSPEYPVRTEQNVVDSDATMILYEGQLKGGTLLTYRICSRLTKPCLLVPMDRDEPETARHWLSDLRPDTLNIAGPRESTAEGIFERAMAFLLQVFARS